MTLMHKEGQLNLALTRPSLIYSSSRPFQTLQVGFSSYQPLQVGFSPSQPLPGTASCCCPALSWAVQELLSRGCSTGKDSSALQCLGEQQGSSEMGTVGGAAVRPHTPPGRRGWGQLGFLLPGLLPASLRECCCLLQGAGPKPLHNCHLLR